MKTVEAFLSVLLLFSAFTFTTQIRPTSDSDPQHTLRSLGYQVFLTVDNEGQLGQLIDEKNWTGITTILNIVTPIGLSYNLTIYNSTHHLVNTQVITNGLVADGDVTSIQYPCVSYNSRPSYYILRLQLALVE
jgi:hypothetical protein